MVIMDRRRIRVNLLLEFVLLAVFGYAILEAQDFLPTARLFPVLVGVLGVIVVLVAVGLDMRRLLTASRSGEAEPSSLEFGPFIGQLASYVGYVVCVGLIGLVLASSLFVIFFMRVYGKISWWWALVAAGGVGGVLYALDAGTRIRFPEGLVG